MRGYASIDLRRGAVELIFDHEKKCDPISGLGLNGQIFGWAGRSRLLFEATTVNWIGLDLIW